MDMSSNSDLAARLEKLMQDYEQSIGYSAVACLCLSPVLELADPDCLTCEGIGKTVGARGLRAFLLTLLVSHETEVETIRRVLNGDLKTASERVLTLELEVHRLTQALTEAQKTGVSKPACAVLSEEQCDEISRTLSQYQRHQRRPGHVLGGPLMAYLRDIPLLTASLAAVEQERDTLIQKLRLFTRHKPECSIPIVTPPLQTSNRTLSHNTEDYIGKDYVGPLQDEEPLMPKHPSAWRRLPRRR